MAAETVPSTPSEMGRKGAAVRWKGKSKKERSTEMRRVALARWAGHKAKRPA